VNPLYASKDTLNHVPQRRTHILNSPLRVLFGSKSFAVERARAKMIDSFRLQKSFEGVVSSDEPSKSDLDKCRSLGKALAEATLKRAEEPKE
jgi:hypothetical protein